MGQAPAQQMVSVHHSVMLCGYILPQCQLSVFATSAQPQCQQLQHNEWAGSCSIAAGTCPQQV